MFWADYHTHSVFSPDGCDDMLALGRAARAAGLREMAVTDHCDMGADDFDAEGYRAALTEARAALEREGLRLVRGLELGEATHDPARAAAVVRDTPLDFVLGSYHRLKGDRDFYYYEDYGGADGCRALIGRYLDELPELIALGCFDVLGHLTYPLRYARRFAGLADVSFSWHREKTEAVLRALIGAGKGLELNVSGLGRRDGAPMPDLDLLKLYRALGGEIVTVGSDAHDARGVGRGIPEGYALLREAGFRYVAAYRERKVRFEALD
ncbi:MAG: PHP domain-containing protein [Oscillospiraceae bacterium]|nr:PHP domain-containing protein [Oscillospiraceae bacterium]